MDVSRVRQDNRHWESQWQDDRTRSRVLTTMAWEEEQWRERVALTLTTERATRGLSQELMARLLNVSLRTYQRWEAGETRPTFPKLQAISELVQRPLADILGLDPGGHTEEVAPPEVHPLLEELHEVNERLARLEELFLAASESPRPRPAENQHG